MSNARLTRLPPLTALKAFESAGRALSFTRAAEDLAVTPGAISRQIRSLEEYLGLQLFVRSGRDVHLTPAGAQYLDDLSNAFAQIRVATSRLISVEAEAPLRVSTSMNFTLRWLMPRMLSFQEKHGSSNLQLTMNLAAVDFQRDDLDATIKIGHETTPHSVVRKLFDAPLAAVCSPGFLKEFGPFETLEQLDSLTLLHSSARAKNWGLWLDAAERPDIIGGRQLEFESSSLAYQAAIGGIGVAMAQLPLILDELRSGALVAAFPIVAPDHEAYNLIWPDRTPRNPLFPAFRDWILQEAKRTQSEVQAIIAQITEASGSGLTR